MDEMFGAEFAVVFNVDDATAMFTFSAETRASRNLCLKLDICNAKGADRDGNGNLLVAFGATREHLRDIRDRMDQSCGWGDFDARYLCVWPNPEGEMLTGEALRLWLEEDT